MPYDEFIKTYTEKGLIKKQKQDFQSAEKFVMKAHKDLRAAQATPDIDEDIAYTIAYSAMLHAGRAFMLSRGLRPADGQQHKTVCEFTAKNFGDEYKIIAKRFNDARKKRNILIYDISLSVSKTETVSIMLAAKEFIELISGIIKKENPQLKFDF